MNTNRDIKRFWSVKNPVDKRQTMGIILNTNETLVNVGDLEYRISDIENFINDAFDDGILKEGFGGTENSHWTEFLKDLSEQLDTAILTQDDDNSYLFIGKENNSGKFSFSSLWNWIVSKLSSVFGLVKNNETGKVTLTADITGNLTGDVTGNAKTADFARMAEKVGISTSTSDANFLLASIDNKAITNGETPKRISLKFNEVSKELSSGNKVFASLEDVNSITAKYITSSADGKAFADEAALLAGDKYYAGQIITTQTTPALENNDYCLVIDSGFANDHATARYVYQNGEWIFQYKICQITLTQSQLDAINSGVTEYFYPGKAANAIHADSATNADSAIHAYTSMQFTYVVDSNQKLADWANNVAGNDYTSVLIRKGTYESRQQIMISPTATKVIVGEAGSVILLDGSISFGYSSLPETDDFYIKGVSIIKVNSYRDSCFYRCRNMSNCYCKATGDSWINGFSECLNIRECYADIETTNSSHRSYGFYACSHILNSSAKATSPNTDYQHAFCNCMSTFFCKALKGNYRSCYSSSTARTGYECADTLNGGWNT